MDVTLALLGIILICITIEDVSTKQESTVPQIYEMRIDTNVSNRYAKTLITSKIRNYHTKAQEVKFSVIIPEKAFISGFIMELDGKQYEAYVGEKEEAKKQYDAAVAGGAAAAHVSVKARDSNRFTVAVNVEPQSKATFYLRYEELLVRNSDKYELVLNIHPRQPVKTLEVVVNIMETLPLKFVKVPSLRSGNEIEKNNSNIDLDAVIHNINDTSAVVTFKPDIVKQKLLASSLGGKEEDGISGQMVVQYDVARNVAGGEVLVDGGYFVHFFSPEELAPLKKQTVFILDTSGSMSGRRMKQLKEAMNSILDELNPEDTFSIVEFNSVSRVWDIEQVKITYEEEWIYSFLSETEKPRNLTILPPSVKASENNIKNAKEVLKSFEAHGATDIDTALRIGLKIVEKNPNPQLNQPIIIFLTDGEPTLGTLDIEYIISRITEHNVNKAPIFSLSFGEDADRNFLQKLSLNNQGFARHIYEAADAHLQLENFYRQISSPLLTNITFRYVDNVENVTKSSFPIVFKGSELYVAGVTDPGFEPPQVEGWGVHGPITLKPKVYRAASDLERLWAYLTVQQILEQRELMKDKTPATRDALALALKYSFVTAVTSLVVVKPNSTSAVETEDASTDEFLDAFTADLPINAAHGSYGSYPYPAPALAFPIPLSGSHGGFSHLAPAIPISSYARPTYTGGFSMNSRKFSRLIAPTYPTTPRPFWTTPRTSWLQDLLANNKTITIDNQTYLLGLNETLGAGQSCANSMNKMDGQCKLIHECKIMHSCLNDFNSYKQYFCNQRSYAGVCCPIVAPQP